MNATTLVVAGLGRCGSSLTMQMLAAGGVECVGSFPSFEDERVKTRVLAVDIEAWRGKSVKILDPQRLGLPGDVRVIWLERNHHEQARSICKFAGAMMGLRSSREQVRNMERGLRADRATALRVIGSRPLLVLHFERLVTWPADEVLKLRDFVQQGGHADAFDVAAAAAAVKRRSVLCESGLEIELALMREGGGAKP